MIIDHGRLLYDGALADLKRQLWRETTVKFDLKDRENARRFEQLDLTGIRREKLGDLTYLLSFGRDDRPTAEVIRQVVNAAEVLDIAIEEQSIEEVVKRIYLGGAIPEEPPCHP
jgi:ABC-2 type transport system ATP-binding protein